MGARPAQSVQLGPSAIAAALRDARRGGAAGLSGMSAEHLKILLADVPAMELLAFAATQLANAEVPADVIPAVALARLTPQAGRRSSRHRDGRRVPPPCGAGLGQKLGGGFFFDAATRPYQFALQARAGTDALAAHVRTALELQEDAVLVSLDGRSADSMSRASFFTALQEAAPDIREALLRGPFHLLLVGRPGLLPGRCSRRGM